MPRSDLVAAQVVRQEKPGPEFKTVTGNLCELIRSIGEKRDAQQEKLRDTVRYFYIRDSAEVGSQSEETFPIPVDELCQAESLFSDSSRSSGSDLSSICLSCDNSIHKVKQMNAVCGSLKDITNLKNGKSNLSLLNESNKPSKILLHETMSSFVNSKTDLEKSDCNLRRSKRILEKRKNENPVSSHANEPAKTESFSKRQKKKLKTRSAENLHNVSWCTQTHNRMAQKAHKETRVRKLSSSLKTDSSSRACDMDFDKKDVNTSTNHQNRCESDCSQMMSKTRNLKNLSSEEGPFHEQLSSKHNVMQSNGNDSLGKDVERGVRGSGHYSKCYYESDFDMISEPESFLQNSSHYEEINSSMHSNSIHFESDMEITKNISFETGHSFSSVRGCETVINRSFMGNSASSTHHIKTVRHERPSNTEVSFQGELPESETLSASLKTYQLNESEVDQVRNFDPCKVTNKKFLKTKRLAQKDTCLSQEVAPKIFNEAEVLSPEDKTRSPGFPVSFANITCRRKNKHEKTFSQSVQTSQGLSRKESNLLIGNGLEDSRNHLIGSQLRNPVSETDQSSDLMAAPESEDFFAFLECVRPDSQKTLNKGKGNPMSPPERDRVYNSFTLSECGAGSINASELENVEVSNAASFNFEGFAETNSDQISRGFSQLSSPVLNTVTLEMNASRGWRPEKYQMSSDLTSPSEGHGFAGNNKYLTLREEEASCIGGQIENMPTLGSHSESCKTRTRSESNQTSKEDFFVINKDICSRNLSVCVQGSPHFDMSSDLFDDSCQTPKNIGGETSGTFEDLSLEHPQLYREKTIFSSGNLSLDSYHNSPLSTLAAGNKKVRFNRRRKEIRFHDFEIISHLPIQSPHRKNLKSCLKKEDVPPEVNASNYCSQDLFESPVQHSSASKYFKVGADMRSKCHLSINCQIESSDYPGNAGVPTTSGVCENSISGSQELFSSGDTDSLDLSNEESNSCVAEKFPSTATITMKFKDSVLSQRMVVSTHESRTAFQNNDQQLSPATTNRDVSRDSLDLFSQ